MNMGLELIASNLVFSFETIVLLCSLVGSIVFFARDFKVGVFFLFFTNGAIFIWFYTAELNFAPALIVFFLSFIVMCFTLYFVDKTVQAGGVI